MESELNTQLLEASRKGDTNTVRKLVKKGVDINTGLDNNNNTALIIAAYRHLNLVKYLIQNGADVNIPDNTGNTALIYAASFGNLKIVKYLTEHGADINYVNRSYITALGWAYMRRHYTIVKYLVQRGADYTLIKNKPIFQEIIKEEVNKLKSELTNTYLTIERGTPQTITGEGKIKSSLPRNLLLSTVYEKPYQEYCSSIDGLLPPIQLIALANILKLEYNLDISWIELCDKIKHALYLLL